AAASEPRIGPPIPTHASIQASRGTCLRAMNAPMKGMNIGALTARQNLFATSKCPHSCRSKSRTKPTAHFQPQMLAQTPTINTIDPPVLSTIGRTNLILPMNFRMTTPITPIGPSTFFILLPVDSVGGSARASVGSEINVIETILSELLQQLVKGASKIC